MDAVALGVLASLEQRCFTAGYSNVLRRTWGQAMKLLAGLLLFVAIGGTAKADDGPQADKADGPLQNFAPEAIAGAVKLRDELAGTIWSYRYRNGKFDMGFSKGGEIQRLKSWKNVRWRIASPSEVILESSGQHMVLRFDKTRQFFWTKDWDGRKATGRPTGRTLSGEAPKPPRKEFAKSTKFAPPRVDLRPEFERRQLGVRRQQQRGSCQVFALVGVLEYQLSQRNKPVDLSEQFLMWAANEANGVERTEGYNPDLLVVGLKKHGICNEKLMPYVPRNEPIDKPSADAVRDGLERADSAVASIKHWTSDIGFTDQDVQSIRKHLDAGSPVTATFCWPEHLSDSQIVDANHVLIDRAVDGRSKGGHGVIVCGYGLDEQAPGGGYFIIRNSWGPAFADQGYARLTFAYARQYGIDAYIVSIR